ncbi:hypothetical protein HN011_001106 [Eciton burchellii]|nr:hypothetical protein HN011_001106 [Eciton burchellii]
MSTWTVQQRIGGSVTTGITDSRFRIGVSIGTPCVRASRTSQQQTWCTQELVRVLQRYVIYVIRRNDNGYLHGEHRQHDASRHCAEGMQHPAREA